MEFVSSKKEQESTLSAKETEEKLKAWPECYYREREPKVRLALLDAADVAGLTRAENEIRRKIYQLRYQNSGHGRTGDMYLRAFMEMEFLHRSGGSIFRKKPKEVLKILKEVGIVPGLTETEEMLLEREIFHMGCLYITLCREDRNFQSVVFGLGKVSPEAVAGRIRSNVECVAVKVPAQYGVRKEAGIWTRALTEALDYMIPG